MTLEEAYRLKGEAITNLEIWQARLKSVNEFIQKELQEAAKKDRLKETEPKS